MADRINDILDKIIEMDQPKQKARPGRGVIVETRSEHPRLTDRKAAERAQQRRQAMERVNRVLSGGLDE